MKKIIKLFSRVAMVLGLAMMSVISARAEDVTVDFTSLGTQTWSNYSLTSGAVTISTDVNGGSNPTTSNAQYRWKTNNIITISTTTGTLKSIQFKTNSSETYGPKCLSYGGSAITSSGTNFTWEAPSNITSAAFTVTSEARLTEIHVTYTTGGSGGSGGGNGADVTFDFSSTSNFLTSYPGSTHPSTGSSYNLETFYYSDGTVFTASGTNRYFNSDGYFMLGKTNATLTLPTFSFDVEKIVVTGRSAASSTVTQNIYVGSDAVSTETTGAQSSNTYMIGEGYEDAGTVYELKVTSNANTQITKIEVFAKDSDSPSYSITNNNQLAYNATSGSFSFTVNNPVTGGATSVMEDVDWISNATVSGSSITFDTTTNSESASRSGVIKLTYTYDTNKTVTKDVTVTQAGAPTPSITAEDVEITYSGTSGSISYTLTNPLTGTMTATTTSDWLSVGNPSNSNSSGTVALTCAANSSAVQRTATVTLTYTYNTDKTVSKEVAVTQTADPNAFHNISDITKTGTYKVKGTIVAKSTRGFVVGDGTGYVYYYNTSYEQDNYSIGDLVKLSGDVSVYGGVYQFTNSATVAEANDSNYSTESPTVLTGTQMDSRVASTTPPPVSNYVQYEGVLSVSGTYYNIVSIDGASTAKGSISYPISTSFTSLNGKKVTVKGYYVGVSSSTYYNTMLESIEEVVVAVPTITLTSTSVSAPATATNSTITVTCSNMGDDPELEIHFFESDGTTATTYDWITASINGDKNVAYEISANTGAQRIAYFKVYGLDEGANDVYSGLVTVTQAAYVATAASLPFSSFTGGRAAIEQTAGLSQSGLGDDYKNAPLLKFDTANDYVILQINESPAYYTLAFDIKGSASSWEGTFKVQTSEDGETYTDLKVYTLLDSSTQTEYLDNLNANVRYIKWLFAEKTTGFNVGLGNISLTRPEQAATTTVNASLNDGHYWATFFNSAACYELPEGAKAYTMNASRQMYLLGDGSIIPANTAVIIMTDAGGSEATLSLTLNKIDDTVVPVSNTNILKGSNYGVVVGGIPSGTPYVLGNKGTPKVLNFYKYVGTGSAPTIPANRAYYVK